MEDREALRVASKLQEVGGALRIQGRELPGHGAAWVHRDSAQKVFMRWLLVTLLAKQLRASAGRAEATIIAAITNATTNKNRMRLISVPLPLGRGDQPRQLANATTVASLGYRAQHANE